MKFIKKVSPKGLRLPVTAARLINMEIGDKAEYHVKDNAIVVLKGRMTAMEMIRAAQSLQELAVDLYTSLAKVCGRCDGCGDAGDRDEFCPMESLDETSITLPKYLREEAGIPEDAKLCAVVNDADGSVTISAAGYDHDLRDVPAETLEMFAVAGTCIGALEEHLVLGDIVYGK